MRYLLLSLAALAVDQLSKQLAGALLVPGERLPVLPPVLFLTYVENPGAAFGLLAGHLWLLIVLGAAAIFVLALYRKVLAEQKPPVKLGVALAAGGSMGNLIDRLRLGRVVDFVDISVWPIFNAADVFIVVGVALLVREVIRNGR